MSRISLRPRQIAREDGLQLSTRPAGLPSPDTRTQGRSTVTKPIKVTRSFAYGRPPYGQNWLDSVRCNSSFIELCVRSKSSKSCSVAHVAGNARPNECRLQVFSNRMSARRTEGRLKFRHGTARKAGHLRHILRVRNLSRTVRYCGAYRAISGIRHLQAQWRAP